MSEKKLTAESLINDIVSFVGLSSETPTEKPEATEEKKESVEMAIEIPDGEYVGPNGTITVVEGALGYMESEGTEEPEEEMEEEAELKTEESTEANLEANEPKKDEALETALSEVEKLKAEVAKLSEAKPLTAAPKAPKKEEKIDLNSLSPRDRVMATIANIKKRK